MEGGRERKDEKWTKCFIQQRELIARPRLGAIQNPAAWRPGAGAERPEDLQLDRSELSVLCVVELSQISSICAFFWLAEIQGRGVLAVITEYVSVPGTGPQKRPLPQPCLPAPRLKRARCYGLFRDKERMKCRDEETRSALSSGATRGPAGILGSPPLHGPCSETGLL